MPFQVLLLLSLLPNIAKGAPVAHPFYEEKSRGWFWKETHPDPVPPPKSAPSKEGASSTPPPQPASAETPLTSAWFRAHLGSIRDAALDDPTPEKVRQYFLLQKILLDKAERFAMTARSVVFLDPTLDERAHHAATPSGHALEQDAEAQTRRRDLTLIGKKAGLLFVFRSDCRYCHLMAPVVSRLSQRTGIRLYSVSLDGGALPGLAMASVSTDPALGEKLHLNVTPAIFLMVPQNGLHLVLEGSSTELELEDRILAAGRSLGGMSPATMP